MYGTFKKKINIDLFSTRILVKVNKMIAYLVANFKI